MKIALISYDYPPDTSGGGIATYVHQAARMLQMRGHHVEVFAGSGYRSGTETENDGVLVHRIQIKARVDFAKCIAKIFAECHAKVSFDVLEGPDMGAEAAGCVRLVPEIPLVVKLHTPHRLFAAIEPAFQASLPKRALNEAIVTLGALRRGINPFEDLERAHALEADEIAAPSCAIAKELTKIWELDPKKVHQFPLPYNPSPELLNIPVETNTNAVTFIGRLEGRKGVLDLAQAIPTILKHCPDAKFRFVGQPSGSPDPNRDMRQYLEHFLQPYHQSVEFTGLVPIDRMPSILAGTDVCVFPSLWDSFGLVCLEAMAAGRGVVGSRAGGMPEIINSNEVGRLVSPKSPQEIAQVVVELLNDSALRTKLGAAARNRVLEEYNVNRVGEFQEASYRRAIDSRRKLGSRMPSRVKTRKLFNLSTKTKYG